MKKSWIIVLLLAVSFGAFAQKSYKVMGWKVSKEKSYPQNELKVNLPMLIFASYPEITYERILDVDMSVGASLGAGLDTDRYGMQFALMPYFRWFFGGNNKSMDRAGAGFYLEANSTLFSAKGNSFLFNDYDGNTGTTSESIFGAGLGIAVGWKYLSKNNWVGDITYGIGRDFVNDGVYPRFGISIGKRF